MKPLTMIGRDAFDVALEHGWWEGQLDASGDLRPEHVPEKLALLHSEVSEMLEAYRKIEDWRPAIALEAADVLIRLTELCVALGVDLDAAVAEKMDINRLRPYKHGGRRC